MQSEGAEAPQEIIMAITCFVPEEFSDSNQVLVLMFQRMGAL